MTKTIAVVGSGTGGTFAANLLASRLHDKVKRGEVSVALIGEGFRHHFQPANLDVAFKGRLPESASQSELDLLRPEVEFFPEPAAKIDLQDRTITSLTDEGDQAYVHRYDYLVLATGAQVALGLVPGLAEGSLNFHTSPWDARKVWEAVRGFKKGRVVVAVTRVPHKCPPSPDEALFMLDEYFRRKGVRDDVELTMLTPYPRPYPVEKISRVVGRLFEERGIKTVPFFNVDSVDPKANKIYSLEGDEQEYDLLIAIPPHRGTGVVRNSGIGDEDGWIPTDKRSLRIKERDDAFAVGDATNIPVSKSGVVAHLEAKAVARTISSELMGQDSEFEYNGRINCPMETGTRRALFVSATYDRAPSGQSPTLFKYAMMRGFGSIYWSALSGRWEWLMDAFFGETAERVEGHAHEPNRT